MKLFRSKENALAILLASVFIFSCYPKPVVREMPATYNPAGELLEKAEDKIEENDYEAAARLLNDLLFQYPKSPEADDALMKNGLILKAVGQFAEARRLFGKLISEYPDSPFQDDAKVEILETILLEGDNEGVARKASEFYPGDTGGNYPPRVLTVVGDAYLNMDNAENAVRLYTMAYKRAGAAEKDKILEKVKGGIARFSVEELESLSAELPDAFPKGYIMYQLGVKKMEGGEYSSAVAAFEQFKWTFPEHPAVADAEDLLSSIREKADEERYTIGCLLPLSGKYEELGQRAWSGIELAIGEFGLREGAPGVRIVIRDSGADPAKAAQAVRELAQGHAAAIIGPLATAEEAAVEAQIQQIPIIAFTLKDKITEIGDFVFRNFLTPKMQTDTLASFVTSTLGLTRFAILYPEEKYGNTFMDLFRDAVIAEGGDLYAVEPYGLDINDYKGPIGKLSGLFEKANGPKLRERLEHFEENRETFDAVENGAVAQRPLAGVGAVFIPDSVEKAGMILPQLAYYGISGVLVLGTNLWHSEKFLRMAQGYTRLVIVTDGFFAESEKTEVRSFVQNYENAYQKTPGFVEAVAYDSAMMVMETLTRGHVAGRSQLKDALLGLRNFPGVTGKTSFGPTGEAEKKTFLLYVKDGRFVELKQPLDEVSPTTEFMSR